MKKLKEKIILAIVAITILLTLCGCSGLDQMKSDVSDFRVNWLDDLRADVSDLRINWFSDLKASAENKSSYSMEDLKRETQNFVAMDFDYTYVAYEDDLQKALEDEENTDIIVIQKKIELTKNLVIPTGKTVLVQSGVIFVVPSGLNVTLESGSSLFLDGASYLVLNENGTCFVNGGASLSVGKSASLLMVIEGAITTEETSIISNVGLLQQGGNFYAYSEEAITTALRSAVDGGVIYLPQMDFGDSENYYIYNVDKAISIVGSVSEEGRTALYGGFVLSGDGASVCGLEIYPPTSGGNITTSSSLGRSFVASGGITIANANAICENNIIHKSESVACGIEIYPYYNIEQTQTYSIKSNTFVGFGDVTNLVSAPILAVENSRDVSKFGKETMSASLGMSDGEIISLVSDNTFEECNLRVTISDGGNKDEIKAVVMQDLVISGDYILDCNYYITGSLQVAGGNVTIQDESTLYISSGVYASVDENSSVAIQDGSAVSLQGGSTLENYGNITGKVSGAGKFLDWPNHIQFSIQTQTQDEVWEEQMVLGEYVGYTASALKKLYIATIKSQGDETIEGYNFEFYANGNWDTQLADDYVFTDDIEIFVKYVGKTFQISYDDTNGSGIGNNRSEFTYPTNVYLENATTRKTDEFFAGWTIVGGTFNGDYISVITDEFTIELVNAGYTSLNLKANWITRNNISEYKKITYLASSSSFDQYDEHCDVNVYTPAGSNSITFDLDDYSYEDKDLALTKVENNTGYYKNAYIFFELEEGYEIESVILVTLIAGGTGTEYNLTNQAIEAVENNMPLIFESELWCQLEVKTRKATNEIQEIKTVGISMNGSFAIMTDFTDFTLDVDDELKFSARTAENDIVTNFYVVATFTTAKGVSKTFTYYDPTSIVIDDDYEDGKVRFVVYAISGRTTMGVEFDKTFIINEE